jgi:diguanylate cyclase (GGDEF)-like protein
MYGHVVGDKVLKMAAETLTNNLRAVDVVGRWGGEEFLVIVHETEGMEKLSQIGEKIRTMVECSHIDQEGKNLAITISIGATLLRTDDDVDSFVKRADQLMYQSKQAGRNRVTTG